MESESKYWLYAPVQHPGYVAIHRAWYKTGTHELMSVEPNAQPLKDVSLRHLIQLLQSVLAGVSGVPLISTTQFNEKVEK